ncbi:MAG: ASKHA domain-containing protein, partial [Sphaerochaetaceae bacterium]|nr:ASKHA domain-containing protein [Sphaerochaetaceae bacterium]
FRVYKKPKNRRFLPKVKEIGRLTVITEKGKVELTSEIERTVLNLLSEGGINQIAAPCGGNGLCGKCIVHLLEGEGSPLDEDEKRLLTQQQIDEGIRLACRLRLPLGGHLTIAPLSLEGEGQVVSTFLLSEGEVEGRDDVEENSYGCAIDIGTTTVVVYLVRLDTQEILAHLSHMNPQRVYGGDVISRIQYSDEMEGGLEQLQKAITGQLSSMIDELLKSYSIPFERLKEIVAVGNPTMIHLLVGANPSTIAYAPFTLVFSEPRLEEAQRFGFNQEAKLILPGLVSGYIGSDVTVGLLATGITERSEKVLYIDIGTNGEIALWDGSKLYCCSSAAGPAFEGASIRQGLGAIPGAIDRVWAHQDGTVAISTINGERAKGICGSAIVDVMAFLLESGLVDESGAMVEEHPFLVMTSEGRALKLTDNVSFTHRDVREVQLAKAAIAAGCQILLKKANLKVEELDQVIVAGGFGSYIDSANAQRIGLLPKVAIEKIVSAGNAAGKGALMVLMLKSQGEKVEAIRRQAQYIELSSSLAFQEEYVEQMFFGEC